MSADGTIKYCLREPLERSVLAICASLRSHGMRVVGELDVSRRLERSLYMTLPPCRIVLVLPQPIALTSQAIHPWAAVFLPLHVVIWGDDGHSKIGIANMLEAGRNGAEAKLKPFGPIVEAQRRLIEAIEAVAVRPSALA
jgi:uncharacterized protein (DUF302 family)